MMLDFARLSTPPRDGDILVAPQPKQITEAARRNAGRLSGETVAVGGVPLNELRRRTRERFTGSSDRPIIVTGHQPAFFHPGVWAKNVVAQSLARAMDGDAVNLVVDNDAPNDTTLAIPVVTDGDIKVERIRFAKLRAGHAYEQLSLQTAAETGTFFDALRRALGDRFESTQLDTFLSAFENAPDAHDWVDQAVAGRCAIEAKFGIDLVDRRVSQFCWEPLLTEMVCNAERFATAYNGALREYRMANRVRGHQRPIPDLAIGDDRIELPVWAYRRGEARRRLFVAKSRDAVSLDADGEAIASVPMVPHGDCPDWPGSPGSEGGWMLRPRALALTLWARLLLADLFIHGIGGAKYDRITDSLIRSYFGIEPPAMACVSATLWLDLPRSDSAEADVLQLKHELRDMRWNPQRYVEKEPVRDLLRQREEAVAESKRLRGVCANSGSRRASTFEEIRELNGRLFATVEPQWRNRAEKVQALRRQNEQNALARGREYFFGLYTDAALSRLVASLPAERDFRL